MFAIEAILSDPEFRRALFLTYLTLFAIAAPYALYFYPQRWRKLKDKASPNRKHYTARIATFFLILTRVVALMSVPLLIFTSIVTWATPMSELLMVGFLDNVVLISVFGCVLVGVAIYFFHLARMFFQRKAMEGG